MDKPCIKCGSSDRYVKSGDCRPCSQARELRKYQNDPRLNLLREAKKRSRRDRLPFSLVLEDIIVPNFCPLLGIPLKPGKGARGPTDNSPSLDKIIPEIGYVRGNIVVISNRANRIKSDSSPEEMALLLRGFRAIYPAWLLID